MTIIYQSISEDKCMFQSDSSVYQPKSEQMCVYIYYIYAFIHMASVFVYMYKKPKFVFLPQWSFWSSSFVRNKCSPHVVCPTVIHCLPLLLLSQLSAGSLCRCPLDKTLWTHTSSPAGLSQTLWELSPYWRCWYPAVGHVTYFIIGHMFVCSDDLWIRFSGRKVEES